MDLVGCKLHGWEAVAARRTAYGPRWMQVTQVGAQRTAHGPRWMRVTWAGGSRQPSRWPGAKVREWEARREGDRGYGCS